MNFVLNGIFISFTYEEQNQLSGSIPPEIADIESLETIDFCEYDKINLSLFNRMMSSSYFSGTSTIQQKILLQGPFRLI